MSSTFDVWKDRIAWGLLAGGVSIGVLWAAWITNEVFDKPTSEEVEKAIVLHAPYTKDRALIIQTLEDARKSSGEFKSAIDNNTKAIIQLQAFLQKSDSK